MTITRWAPKVSLGTQHILYPLFLFLIIGFSFAYYAPCNYSHYNSDHAIHVLMAHDFQLPRDLYYWGQDRLGSLLPMVSFMVSKILPLETIIICSLVEYVFLFVGFIICASRLNNIPLKLALAAVIFLPVNEFNALILIGHPYSSQFFVGALYIYSASLLRNYIVSDGLIFGIKELIKSSLLSFQLALLFIVGVWISEFSAILILIPVLYILLDKQIVRFVLDNFKNKYFLLFVATTALFFILFFSLYKYVKELPVIVQDELYNKPFLDNLNDVKKSFIFFLKELHMGFLGPNDSLFENLFDWLVLFLSITVIATYKKWKIKDKNVLINTLVIISLISCLVMFFSTWNLRSEFRPRYFIPVYIMYCFALLLIFDNIYFKNWTKIIVSCLFVFLGVRFCYGAVIAKGLSGPIEQYEEFKKLPKGTLLGNYWDAYKINSIAIDSMQCLPFNNENVRNFNWRNKCLAEKNFYFLNKENEEIKQTVFQYGYFFQYAGIKYDCNNTEVLLYHKLLNKELKQFRLQADNNKYVSLNENGVLIANQNDPDKAEVFELIILQWLGVGFRSSNNKFIGADLSTDNKVYANKESIMGWESFEIVPINKFEVNIRLVNGNYVCADGRKGDTLFANRNHALEWERFYVEPK